MNFDTRYFFSLFGKLIAYAPLTLLIAVVAMALAILIGGIVSGLELSKSKVLRGIGKLYVSFFRGMPTLVQLFLIFYGLPQLFPVFRGTPAIEAAIVALGFKEASYLAEIFRAGINSVDTGQIEAGDALHISRPKLFFHIVLPQAFLNALPATGNTFVSLLKETSLVFTLGITELFGEGRMLAGSSFKYFETYLALGIIYWLLIVLYTYLQGIVERKLSIPYQGGV